MDNLSAILAKENKYVVKKSKVPNDLVLTKADEHAIDLGCYYDQKEVSKVLKFAEKVYHGKGQFADQPFHILPWELLNIRQIYGWRRPDGRRRIRKCLITVAKGNGKSYYGCFIALQQLIADGERSL